MCAVLNQFVVTFKNLSYLLETCIIVDLDIMLQIMDQISKINDLPINLFKLNLLTVSLVKLNVLQIDVNVGLTTTFTTYLGFRFRFHSVISAMKFIKKITFFKKCACYFCF